MNFFFWPTEFAMPLSHCDSVRRFKILPGGLKNGAAKDSRQVPFLSGTGKMIPLREVGAAVFLNHSRRPPF
jgi:hypothetical protein